MLKWLFGSPISTEVRQQVVAYLRALQTLNARQDDAAEIYNQTLVAHLGGIAPGNDASRIIAEAAAKMASSNRQLLEEHGNLGSIPDEAGRCYMTWHSTYLALVSWSDAAAAAYRSFADGGTPFLGRVGQLLQEEEKWKNKAIKAEGELMKRIKLSADEARELLT